MGMQLGKNTTTNNLFQHLRVWLLCSPQKYLHTLQISPMQKFEGVYKIYLKILMNKHVFSHYRSKMVKDCEIWTKYE